MAAIPYTVEDLREYLFEQTFLRDRHITMLKHEGFKPGDITIFRAGWFRKEEFLFEVVSSDKIGSKSENTVEAIRMGMGLIYLRHHLLIRKSHVKGWVIVDEVSFASRSFIHSLFWARIIRSKLSRRRRIIENIHAHRRSFETGVLQPG